MTELSLLPQDSDFISTIPTFIENLEPTRPKDLIESSYSECASELNNTLKKIVATDATVLIIGESGTGKSVLARKIHNQSHLRNGNFVEVHCTSIPEELLESELFGHEKGSFTGAHRTKQGKVEEAEGGTLFLDEIGELPLSSQAKLLRLLQEKVITRIGSNHDRRVNTRIVLATNKNLKQMVDEGKFRADLYYRINIFEFNMPTLRQRKQDVFPLINTFLHANKKRLGVAYSFCLGPKLRQILENYEWPGNVRELKNVIERLCYLADGPNLKISDLPHYFHEDVATTPSKKSPPPTPTSYDIFGEIEPKTPPLASLAEIEREHIKLVLEKEKCLEKAAQLLGITTVTLWRKRKTYNLQ